MAVTLASRRRSGAARPALSKAKGWRRYLSGTPRDSRGTWTLHGDSCKSMLPALERSEVSNVNSWHVPLRGTP